MQPDQDCRIPVACVRRNRALRRVLLVLVLLSVQLLVGCAGAKPYTVKSLPARWRARPTANARTIGLSKLAFDPTPSDQIGSGDVIDVHVAGGISADDSASFTVRVNDDGRAVLPQVGPVLLANATLDEAETSIKAALIDQALYKDPHVAVTMRQKKTIKVLVVGAVESEGSYELPAGSAGVLQALSAAGGLSKEAGTHVEVRYPAQTTPASEPLVAQAGGSGLPVVDGVPAAPAHSMVGMDVPVQQALAQTLKIDLAKISTEEPKRLALPDGAVVNVERLDPPPIQVLGLVNHPEVYEFPVGKDLHLLDAIAMAGGQSSLVADKVFVIRRRPEEPEPALIQVSMRSAKRYGEHNILLEPGDTVSLEQTPSTVMLEAIKAIGFNVSAFAFR